MRDAVTAADLAISDLGACKIPSPVSALLGESAMLYVGEADKVLLDDRLSMVHTHQGARSEIPAFALAGPRNRIFWRPEDVRAGVVTCGGLCPGLNNVVRGIVLELWRSYGVRHILGFRYGYEGLVPRFGHEPMTLDPLSVSRIHHQGGTVLGTSRGKQDPAECVATLHKLGINQLYVVGGDGTMRGAQGGNVRLKDIGTFLRDRINAHFAERKIELNLKYLDPSYHIRSVPASPSDSVYCWHMARNAVHAAMAGNTCMLVGRWHGRFVHLPMAVATRRRKEVEPTGDLWMSVLEATGQPAAFSS